MHCSPFVHGYLQALFFTDTNHSYTIEEWDNPQREMDETEGRLDGSIPADAGLVDFDQDSLATLVEECELFQLRAKELLDAAYAVDYDEAQAGSDFWFTRNHHGVGFWDRDLGEIGVKLSVAALEFRESNTFFYDNHIYTE